MLVEQSKIYSGLRAFALATLLFFAHQGFSVAQDCGDCGVGGWDYSFDPCTLRDYVTPDVFVIICPNPPPPPPPPPPPDDCMAKNDMLRDNGCLVVTNAAPYAAGGVASLRVKAYPATNTGSLTLNRIVVVLPGFSVFFDETSFQDTINSLSSNQLASNLRANGVDLLVVDYGNSADYIQNNAMATVRLLQLLGTLRPNATQAVLLGESMGGLVGRYALTYMEHHNIPHNVGTYISFDTPHQGANVPVGLQFLPGFLIQGAQEANHQVNRLLQAGSFILNTTGLGFFLDLPTFPESDTSSAAAILSALESPAARQMLIGHFASGNGSDALKNQLYAELQYYGWYPTKTRNVALTNGRVDGRSTSTIQPGTPLASLSGSARVIEHVGSNGDAGMAFGIWSGQPYATVFSGSFYGPELDWDWGIPNIDRRYYLPHRTHKAPHLAIWADGAPGSTTNTLGLVASYVNSANLPFGPLHISTANHTFIPTYSALDLELADFGGSPMTNLLQAAGNSEQRLTEISPFDKIYFAGGGFIPASYGGSDEQHLAITSEKASALFGEILGPQTPMVRQRPSRPSLAMTFEGYGDVVLTWAAPGNPVTRYELQSLEWDQVTSTSVGTLAYSGMDTRLVIPFVAGIPGWYGNFRVRACNASGCGQYSSIQSFRAWDIDPGPG